MTTRPVQISYRNLGASPALEKDVRERVAWLESFHPGIVGCRVLLEVPNLHRRRGRPLHVRIELSLPGEDVIVDRVPTSNQDDRAAFRKSDEVDARYKDAYVAIHDAFDIARRRLEDVARRQRGAVKSHAAANERS